MASTKVSYTIYVNCKFRPYPTDVKMRKLARSSSIWIWSYCSAKKKNIAEAASAIRYNGYFINSVKYHRLEQGIKRCLPIHVLSV